MYCPNLIEYIQRKCIIDAYKLFLKTILTNTFLQKKKNTFKILSKKNLKTLFKEIKKIIFHKKVCGYDFSKYLNCTFKTFSFLELFKQNPKYLSA